MISRFCFGGKERKNIMGLLTFKGGIHPDDGKRFSKDSEIRTLLPKGVTGVSAFTAYRSACESDRKKRRSCFKNGQKDCGIAGGFCVITDPCFCIRNCEGIEYRFNPAGTKQNVSSLKMMENTRK